MSFRRADDFEKEKILGFLSEELLYNIEIITILENIGIRGKSFSLYVLEDAKDGISATLFVAKHYANLYVAKELRLKSGKEIFQYAWRLLKLAFDEKVEHVEHGEEKKQKYLYVNEELELDWENLPIDHVITQCICFYPDDLKQKREHALNNKRRYDLNQRPKNDVKHKIHIEALKNNQTIMNSVLSLHQECFDGVLSAENYGKLIDLNMMKSYYLQVEDQVVCKGEWIVNNRNIAYISGLCTKAEFRNMGFCSVLLNRMLTEIADHNRMAVLNYESEDLSRFYFKLGFRREYVRRRVWLKI